jgi:hypothetical protein
MRYRPSTLATSTHVLPLQKMLFRHVLVTPIRESAGGGEATDSRGVSDLLTVDLDQLPQESSCRHARTPCGCESSELPPPSFVLVVVRRSCHVLRVLSLVREACASPFSMRLTFERDQPNSLLRRPMSGIDAFSSTAAFQSSSKFFRWRWITALSSTISSFRQVSRYMTAFPAPATAARRYLELEKARDRQQIVRRDGDLTDLDTNHLAEGALHRLGDLTLGKPVRLTGGAQRRLHLTTCSGRQIPGDASAATKPVTYLIAIWQLAISQTGAEVQA